MPDLARYGTGELRRAAALVKAVVAGDLPAVHVLGPVEQEWEPVGDWDSRWLDEAGYASGQRSQNPDHELVFSLVHLSWRMALMGGADPATVAQTLDVWLSKIPQEG